MAGPFILYEANGSPKAGDALFDPNMRSLCDEISGYVVDTSTGDIIYGTRPEEG